MLIFFHGNAGNGSDRITQANEIYKMGVDVILAEYRGYGKSEGNISEDGLYKDAEAWLSFALKDYKQNDIFLLGRSIGSVATVNVAQDKNLAGVILVTPLSNAKDMTKVINLPILGSLVARKLDNMSKINSIKSKILFLHGDNDKLIPLSLAKKLYTHFSGKKEFVLVKNAGHNDIHFYKIYNKSIEKFIKD